MELTLRRPSQTATTRGSKFLDADSNEKSLSELLEPEPMEGANWIDFGEANEFHESMRHSEQIWEQQNDDDSTIPVGSDVDLGAPLTDLEDFNGSQNLDSELVDDVAALERMKELLGQEVSRRSAKYLSGRPKLSSQASSNSDEDGDDSIQLELLTGRSTSASTGRSKMHSSKGSNMTASTAPMYGEKPRKSKKSSKDDKKKKKKRRSRSRDGDESDSGDDVCLTYQPLGESDDHNPVAVLDDDGEDPFTQLLQKAV